MAASNPTPSQAGKYHYLSLPPNRIRLLRRLGKTEEGLLRFSMLTFPLTNNVPTCNYHCLSYTWGNPLPDGAEFEANLVAKSSQYHSSSTWPICVDGKVMLVQKNLIDALSALPTDAYTAQRAALLPASAQGDSSELRQLLRSNVEVNVEDEHGKTPLHYYAAEMGDLDSTRALVYLDCQISRDNSGSTPLDLALQTGHKDAIDSLQALPDGQDRNRPLPKVRCQNNPDDFIWIDAACINQSDEKEKSRQVSMMDLIYRSASYTIIWLGQEDERTAAGIKTLRLVAANSKKLFEGKITVFGGSPPEAYDKCGMPYIPSKDWDALASIYLRQWFRRAWIVQEACLSKQVRVFCGSHEIDWHELGTAAQSLALMANVGLSWSHKYGDLPGQRFGVEHSMSRLFSTRELLVTLAHDVERDQAVRDLAPRIISLSALATSFSGTVSTDPKDKVFSLFGIRNLYKPLGTRVPADYSLPLSSLYTMATRSIIWEDQNLSYLSRLYSAADRSLDLRSSWVLDFRNLAALDDAQFTAAKGLHYEPHPSLWITFSPHLTVRGIHLSTVETASNRALGFLRLQPDWFRLAASLFSRDDTARPCISEMLWKTLCFDTSVTGRRDFYMQPQPARPLSFGPRKTPRIRAPDTFGTEFSVLVELMIQAEADHCIRSELELLYTYWSIDGEYVIPPPSFSPFPDESLSEVISNIKLIRDLDGDNCCLPNPVSVRQDFNCPLWNAMRIQSQNPESIETRMNLPELDVLARRLVGHGCVNPNSMVVRTVCDSFMKSFCRAYRDNELFATDDRRLGLGPRQVQKDDEIWLVAGCDEPLVLRRVLDQGEFNLAGYQVLGTAYVHGIMDGEGAEGLRNEVLTEIILV